jgi:hypothetical protein
MHATKPGSRRSKRFKTTTRGKPLHLVQFSLPSLPCPHAPFPKTRCKGWLVVTTQGSRAERVCPVPHSNVPWGANRLVREAWREPSGATSRMSHRIPMMSGVETPCPHGDSGPTAHDCRTSGILAVTAGAGITKPIFTHQKPHSSLEANGFEDGPKGGTISHFHLLRRTALNLFPPQNSQKKPVIAGKNCRGRLLRTTPFSR